MGGLRNRQVKIIHNGRVIRVMPNVKAVSECYDIPIKTVYNALERGGRILWKYRLVYEETKMEHKLGAGARIK